jgi:hypothetical protein
MLLTGGRSVVSKKSSDTRNIYWEALCEMFLEYLKKNGLGDYSIKFNNEHSFQKMNARTKRLFMQASPQFLENLELPQASSSTERIKREDAFNVWSLYVSISFILNSYTIVGSQLRFARENIPFVVNYIKSNFPHLVTNNLHYLLHICYMIELFG